MKTIYLIRHAESSWKSATQIDYERPINTRGKKDISTISSKLKEQEIKLDFIVSSSAKRTTQTSLLICDSLGLSNNIVKYEDKVYEAPLTDLIEVINDLPNEYNVVALIGHNPSITYLSNYLTENYIDNIPTCGVVKIELEINNWNEIIKGIGLQKFFIYPKMF